MTNSHIRGPLTGAVAFACLICAALPSSVGAFASVGPAPIPGSPGLPDGRVYEQASPTNKNGNQAGTPGNGSVPAITAEAGGDGVAYGVFGAVGETKSGNQFMAVAKRAGYGWSSYGAQPLSIGEQELLNLIPSQIGFSADLTKVVFWALGAYLPEVPQAQMFMYDIPADSTTWLDPPPADSQLSENQAVEGFSSDMSTVYFDTGNDFYEWHDGVESTVGVLPDGSVEPGAVPAGSPVQKGDLFHGELRNQVSEDGAAAFFAAGSPAELYVRETAADGTQSTVLVSRDALLPDVGGLPAPAPHGVIEITFPGENASGEALSSNNQAGLSSLGYVYASPDGSRAFFASEDQLTSAAPAGGGMYEFNTDTGSLTYLPGVGASPILVSSHDGTSFLFNGPAGVSLWSEAGPEGGTVTPIEPFPVGGEARATPDGSVFVFESAVPFAGFNNGGTHVDLDSGVGGYRNQEIYRYDVAEGSLDCVSCPPAGIVPSGNAYMSHAKASNMFESRGVSEDGSRVFFDSPDPLVPQDSNTQAPERHPGGEPAYHEHGRDVYEWENGRIFLISTGTSTQDSYIGDESANGNDVFFSTVQGLAPGDTDEDWDVYDARVPRPGDHAPPPAAACEGDVCQGPPPVPDLLGAPASATFSGLGNPAPESAPGSSTPKTVTKKTVKCAKDKRLTHGKCVKAKSKKKRAKAKKPAKGGK
jgi:hypothetical protein